MRVDDAKLKTGDELLLGDQNTIVTPVGKYEFQRLGDGYCGLILGPAGASLGLQEGQTAELGRQPRAPGLAFPRPGPIPYRETVVAGDHSLFAIPPRANNRGTTGRSGVRGADWP